MCNLQRTFHKCFLPSFGSFGQAVSAIFKKSTNQKQLLPVVAMFVNGSDHNVQSLYKVAHFLPIRCQTWLPQAILVSAWLI
jgi:hypothetical protein